MDKREAMKLLRNAPPREALDAIEDEITNIGSFTETAEVEQTARTIWERALDAIIYA